MRPRFVGGKFFMFSFSDFSSAGALAERLAR